MGMAASQARLLTITSRLHDVEYQAQNIQNAKIALATQSDEVYQDYLKALDATTLTVKDNNGQTVQANFNTLCGINAARANMKDRYLLRDDRGKIIVSEEIASGYKAFEGHNAYEFAMFMMEGQPDDFDDTRYRDQEFALFNQRTNEGNLPTELETLRDSLVKKIYAVCEKLIEVDETYDNSAIWGAGTSQDERESYIKENLLDSIQSLKQTFGDFDKINAPENDYTESVAQSYNTVKKDLANIDSLYQTFEYKMYYYYNEEIYEGAGNDKNDFESDDFWYYVNMYKQIEANGGRITLISEYDGLTGMGNAAADSDWLKEAIQSGKITIDVSTLDNKGNISFSSTSVPSDNALEYTTTSTLDKSYLAKAEAEYEHKTKEIDRKDKKYDMDLSKLETERSALTTEYDSVKKVVEDNIKRTFGIFS